MSNIYVQFSDATETVIVATFAGPQGTTIPNQGTVPASDARWAAFYAALPASAQALLTPPTTPLPPTAAQTAAAAYAAFIAGGLTVSSTGTPALNGVYGIDPASQQEIGTEAQFISTFQEFTNGTTIGLQWYLQNRSPVTFPSTSEFLAFVKAAAQVVAGAKLALGQVAAMPVATATIP
jgi:hypothetical protein